MRISFPFDAIRRSEEVEALVMDGNRRLYYRFRSSGHYGGVVTADSVGCNLLCAYCWNYRRNLNPTQGDLCSPEEVVSKLRREAARTRNRNFRISGAEPILGSRSARHLAEVLRAFPGRFIVETNGVMLGYNPELLDLLLPHHPYIRLTMKGDSPDRFQEITGADRPAFQYQINAARELQRKRGAYGIAAMAGAVDPRALSRIFPDEEIEWEEFGNFGNAGRNLSDRGVRLDRL